MNLPAQDIKRISFQEDLGQGWVDQGLGVDPTDNASVDLTGGSDAYTRLYVDAMAL